MSRLKLALESEKFPLDDRVIDVDTTEEELRKTLAVDPEESVDDKVEEILESSPIGMESLTAKRHGKTFLAKIKLR